MMNIRRELANTWNKLYEWDFPKFHVKCSCGKEFETELSGLKFCDECSEKIRKELGITGSAL